MSAIKDHHNNHTNGVARQGQIKPRAMASNDHYPEMIGAMPRWIASWGVLLLCAVLALMVVGASYFRFRDVVVIRCMINATENPHVARAMISKADYMKVKNGEKVTIKLASFPFEEYGTLDGRVTIPEGPLRDSVISINMSLTNGLVSSSNKQIPPLSNLYGEAEIHTEEKSILKRLIERSFHD